MNDFISDLEARYQAPSPAEIDRLIAEAHRMRQQALRDALVGVWGVLRRSIPNRPAVTGARTA